MLDQEILDQLRGIFAPLESEIELRMLAAPDQPGADRMREFLADVVSTSPKLTLTTASATVDAPTFRIIKGATDTGVSFCGIPNGHEFTTLLLAILNADGRGKNLPDKAIAARIKALRGPIELQTFVSLTCTNCPEVAQALNVMALLNGGISNCVTDGAVVPDLVARLNIQSVPAVFAGGELLAVGRLSLGDLLGRLEAKFGGDGADVTISHEYQVLVAGGGPAGVAAAIYAARKGFRTGLVAKTIGGQVKDTMAIDNLISVSETTGPRLADDLRAHLQHYDIDLFESRTIDSATLAGDVKQLVCGPETFSAPALIIATGAAWRKLGVPGEEEHIGHGVAFCVHCDGPFYAGKNVAVVGGGNSGIEAAIDLAAICPMVDVFEFMPELKADKVLIDKVTSLPNVNIHVNTQVLEVLGPAGSVDGLKVKDRESGAETVYPLSGVFVQIGLVPNAAPFRDQLGLTKGGEIIIDVLGQTSVPGVYAAGDVASTPYKQIVIAMGSGATAALTATARLALT